MSGFAENSSTCFRIDANTRVTTGSGLVPELAIENDHGLKAKGGGSLRRLLQAVEAAIAHAEQNGAVAVWAIACGGDRKRARERAMKWFGFEKMNSEAWVYKLEDVDDALIEREIMSEMFDEEPLPASPPPATPAI